MTTSGHERHDDAVAPGRGRADHDQGVHVGRAVASGPPGRPVEPAAGPDLDDRRRDEDEPVELDHAGIAVCGANIRTMIPSATAIETDAWTSRARASRVAVERRPRELASASDAGGGRAAGRAVADVVAGRLDGADQGGPVGASGR